MLGESPFFLPISGIFFVSIVENSLIERVKPVIEKKLASMGLELYELKCVKAGSRLIVRIYIDKDGSITVDDCEKASNEISILLDVENFSQISYTLEVSSPGIDRTLTTEKDFRRAVGNTVKLNLKRSEEKNKTVLGRLVTCSNGNINIEMVKGMQTIPLSDINSGKIEIKF